MYKKDSKVSKGLAVYFYPELDREVIVVGVFEQEEDVLMGRKPLKYTVWDQLGRLDKYDFDEWDSLPTREEVKIHYIDLL